MPAKYLLASLVIALAACSDSSDNRNPEPPIEPPQPQPELSAEIRRTEYGIPHVTAGDWPSLGYGFGYAYAQDNFCIVMREIVFSLGRSAELIGEANGGNVDTDLLFTFLHGGKENLEQEFFAPLSQTARDLYDGFARGMNRYLDETGVDNLPEGERGCRGADWVFPIDGVDLLSVGLRQALRGSSTNGIFESAILATEGPDAAPAASRLGDAATDALRRDAASAGRLLRNPDQGSNALALGRDITVNGSGLLLGNPHQPWFGEGAWYLAHLTIPGVYDAGGAALHGTPFIGIGFTEDLAWTHTVSLANRFSLYELQLVPDNPLQYVYGDEIRDITSTDVIVQSLQDDGSLVAVSKTFYESHYGPIVNLKDVSPVLDGWPLGTGTVLSFRDANLTTVERAVDQWLAKAQATDIAGYIDALSDLGNFVFHEIAADRNGDAYYGELSAIPFISQAQLDTCVKPPLGSLLAGATTNVLITLDGSDPDCEWGVDPEAPEGSGLYGPGSLPQFTTTDYVGNSNNSYWLSDANNPVTGFPTIMGPVGHEGLQQFLRTRIGHLMVEERRQADGWHQRDPVVRPGDRQGFHVPQPGVRCRNRPRRRAHDLRRRRRG